MKITVFWNVVPCILVGLYHVSKELDASIYRDTSSYPKQLLRSYKLNYTQLPAIRNICMTPNGFHINRKLPSNTIKTE